MPAARTYVRYAHGEGHAAVAYLDGGAKLVTAGDDGELRIWAGIDDDDPESHRLGDTVSAMAAAGDRVFVGTDVHAVAVFRLPSVRPDGVLTRYTAPVTDIAVCGALVASAGADMVARVTSLDGQKQRQIDGFAAPVLSVSLCPAARVLLTTCCDGNATFWNAISGEKIAQHALLPKCNDIVTAKSLARPSWSPDGKTAAVPVADGVILFSGAGWTESGRLKSPLVTSPVTVCAFSPCGRFVAAAIYTGQLLEWRLAVPGEARVITQHEGQLRINVLAWHPDGNQIAFTDCGGQLGVTSGVTESRGATAVQTNDVTSKKDDELLDLDDLTAAIDEDDDRDLLEAALDGEVNTLEIADTANAADDDDDDDENVISLRRIKAESGFLTDSEAPKKETGSTSATPVPPPAAPVARGPAFAEPQSAFQPGSTPAHLERRFLIWNAIGVVTSHEGDSLDIEFHDTAIHHPLHLKNTFGHTMAALSEEALVLAAPSQSDDTPGRIQCLHFGSWDSNKEWFMDLPDGEDPEAVAIGDGWLAVATSTRRLRVITLTGVQKYVLSVAGPVVCLSGWEKHILVVHHAGTGLPGDQQMVLQVLSASGRRHPRVTPVPVPLSPRALLAWTGFTDQGSPCVHDTAGSLQLLTAGVWTPLEVPHPGSDHVFVVGVSELEQSVRGLLCRGSRYPAVLPRPTLSVLSLRLPLAERDTDRGRLEEETARAALLLAALSRLDAAGFDTAEARAQPERERAAALTQLFALACRSDREHRALDVAAHMSSVSNVEAVAGYASRQRRTRLAERLMQLAQALADDPDEEEVRPSEADREPSPARSLRSDSRPASRQSHQSEPAPESEETQFEEAESEEVVPVPSLPSLGASAARPTNSPAIFTPSPRNPFRCDSGKPPSAGGKGSAVFDELKRQQLPPTKRVLSEGKANSAAKMKRPRVSRAAAAKLTSIKSIFSPLASKAVTKSSGNEENENGTADKDTVSTQETDTESARQAGSGVNKLSAFAFSSD